MTLQSPSQKDNCRRQGIPPEIEGRPEAERGFDPGLAAAQNQRRGGADLCVRSAVPWPEDPQPNGQSNRTGRKPQSAPIQVTPPPGPRASVAGARTSVSAPLCDGRKTPVAKGSQTTWSEDPLCTHPRDIAKPIAHRHPPNSFPHGEFFPTCQNVPARSRNGWDGKGGWVDPGLFSAHWSGGLPKNAQWADTEVRAPAIQDLGPGGRCAWRDGQWKRGWADPGLFSDIGAGGFRRVASGRTQRSALPSPCISSLADGVLGSTPIGPGAWTHPPPAIRHSPPAFGGPFAVARHPTSGYHQR